MLFGHLSRLDNGTHMPCPDGLDWSAGSSMNCRGMGHWKRLIKIPSGADCYYCINHMTYSTHVSIIVPLSLLLFLICYPHSCHLYTLLHFLIFVILHVVTHYSWIYILRIAYMLLYVYFAYIITVYAQHSSMVMLHTAQMHVHFYHVTTIQYYLLYKIGYYCRHDPMITC